MATHWSPNPSTIGRELVRRVAAIEPALGQLATSHASRGESAMKAGAPWGDKTGNARQGLFGEAEGTTITLGGTADYQVFLEKGTSKMAPRPIIMPTAETTASEYFADAAKVVKGILG